MTPERLAKIEAFRYTPEGQAAQCFLDELCAEVRACWAYIGRLETLRDDLKRCLTDDGAPDAGADAGEPG